jgi:hypothetical protein
MNGPLCASLRLHARGGTGRVADAPVLISDLAHLLLLGFRNRVEVAIQELVNLLRFTRGGALD